MPDQVQDTTVKEETGEADQDHSLIFEDITAQAIRICIEATLDKDTETDAAITGACHDNCTPPMEATAINLATMCHIYHLADHPHIEVLQFINPEITIGHIHDNITDLQCRTNVDQDHTPSDHEGYHTPRT